MAGKSQLEEKSGENYSATTEDRQSTLDVSSVHMADQRVLYNLPRLNSSAETTGASSIWAKWSHTRTEVWAWKEETVV
jgi:hypothetical protein